MGVRADGPKARDKFVEDDQVVKTRDPKASSDRPDQKNRERPKPRPPAAPDAVEAAVSAAHYLVNYNARKQKRVNNRTFDQHSGREQTKHYPSVLRSPRLTRPDFFPDQKSDQKNHERERHVRANKRRQPWTQQIETEGCERNQADNISISARCASKQDEGNQPRAKKRRQPPRDVPRSRDCKKGGGNPSGQRRFGRDALIVGGALIKPVPFRHHFVGGPRLFGLIVIVEMPREVSD